MSDHEGKGECPMALIQMQNLSFHYEGSYDNVFTNASFQLDTDWKLGFIARNGRGKTTLLRILAGELPYAGRIETPVRFSLFPPEVTQPQRSARSVAKGLIGPYEALEAAMAAASCFASISFPLSPALRRRGCGDGRCARTDVIDLENIPVAHLLAKCNGNSRRVGRGRGRLRCTGCNYLIIVYIVGTKRIRRCVARDGRRGWVGRGHRRTSL